MAEDFQKKLVCQIASKLLAEGLAPSRFSQKKAKDLTKNTVSAHRIHEMIEKKPKAIKSAMKKLKQGKACY